MSTTHKYSQTTRLTCWWTALQYNHLSDLLDWLFAFAYLDEKYNDYETC